VRESAHTISLEAPLVVVVRESSFQSFNTGGGGNVFGGLEHERLFCLTIAARRAQTHASTQARKSASTHQCRGQQNAKDRPDLASMGVPTRALYTSTHMQPATHLSASSSISSSVALLLLLALRSLPAIPASGAAWAASCGFAAEGRGAGRMAAAFC
jgi:hypothetical protein